MDREYQLYIADSYTPATLPMQRLAEYMAAFARLLGEENHVHFCEIEPGSVRLKAVVDCPAQPKVRARLQAIRDGEGVPEARKAFEQLDEMLRQDNAQGTLAGTQAGLVIPFPGRTRPVPLVFGPFMQFGTLDGQVFRVGGLNEREVPVAIQDGELVFRELVASRELARSLGIHLFGPTLRFQGQGKWFRTNDGTWKLNRFKITSFEELSDKSLEDIVAELRRTPGSRWSEEADPVEAILRERYGDEGAPH